MKRILVFILCAALTLMVLGLSFADNDEKVIGLQEKLNSLFIKNNFTQEQIDSMNQQYIDEFNRVWPSSLEGYKAMGMMKTNSDEAEYAYRLNEAQLSYDNGVLVSFLNTNRYAEQYAQAGNFSYLFSGQKIYNVPAIQGTGRGLFSVSGEYVTSKKAVSDYNWNGIVIPNTAIELLRDKDRIQSMLVEYAETTVLDIRVFTLSHSLTFLYIKCENNEYLIKLYASYGSGELIQQIDFCKLYPASVMWNAFMDASDESHVAQGYAKNISAIKPTFTAEAESLQQAGLLQGNEKGLDLLKPLSRIEATTLLVRALGLENEPTGTESKFVDIPNDNWGVKYANIAADQGITVGVGDGKFAPDALVTDNQFATMLLRAVDTPEFDWQTAIQILIDKGIITQEEAKTMDLFTRGDMAKIIYEAREKGLLKK